MGVVIKVGMADLKTGKTPDILTTLGLGSCIGIALWDPVTKIGGLAHVMLPDSTKIRNNSNIAKFADTGIDALINALEEAGIRKCNLKAKIAGGACMFTFVSNEIGSIGRQNVDAVRAKLQEHKIKIVAEDVGDKYGRTIKFDPSNCELEISKSGNQKKII